MIRKTIESISVKLWSLFLDTICYLTSTPRRSNGNPNVKSVKGSLFYLNSIMKDNTDVPSPISSHHSIILKPLKIAGAITKALWYSWFRFRWTPSSKSWLTKLDKKIRSKIQHKNHASYVEVTWKDVVYQIWTVVVEGSLPNNTPVVMVHGMMGGNGMFINNVDAIAEQRNVILIDLPGFGLSSRPDFRVKQTDGWKQEETTPDDIEDFYANVLELWFQKMRLSQVILLGHSYGGYLASLYALQYPDRLKHLVLADPWGFPQKPTQADQATPRSPLWRAVGRIMSKMNAFTPIRAMGPLGPSVFRTVRGDLNRKFDNIFDDSTVINYLYACNTWDKPSGEEGFGRLSVPFAWAKNPMVNRAPDWEANLPVTFIYGARSWMDKTPAYEIKYHRNGSYVDVQVIQGAGHHVYADRPAAFNDMICKVGNAVDRGSLPDISLKTIQRHQQATLRRRDSSISEAAMLQAGGDAGQAGRQGGQADKLEEEGNVVFGLGDEGEGRRRGSSSTDSR